MALEAEHITFAYSGGRRRGGGRAGPGEGPVLRDVSLRVEPGEVVAILGPNAAGKTTLLRVLLGALRPDEGGVRLDGAEIGDLSPAARARRVAYIGQRSQVAFSYSLRQVVALGVRGRRVGRERVERALERVGLAERGGEPFAVLSAGQRQRGSVARALAQLDGGEGPGRYLLADEPFSALDPKHVLEVSRVLRGLAGEGVGVAVVLHDLSLADRLADRAVLLGGGGRVEASGPVGEVLAPGVLEGVYGVRFERLVRGEARALAAVGVAGDR